MLRHVLRVSLGLVAASFAAALVLVLHVTPLAQLPALDSSAQAERLRGLAELLGLITTQIALFIVPFGLITSAVTEVNRLRGVFSFLVIGLALAAAAYLIQFQSESEMRTVLNPYAMQVFALQGLAGGFAYWLFAGRFAGWRRGGGPFRTDPIPVAAPRLKVSDAVEPTGNTAKR
jgi:hypothetical protein